MNKIVVVGHPTSGYEEVQSVLRQCGMAKALPSRRERLSPQAITATLCKAHKTPPIESVVDEEGYTQIQPAPVWQGMALDLMLGNVEQPLWGWADSQTVYALDYWKALDPQLTFVFVYDEPHRVLMDAVRRQQDDTDASPTAQDLHRALDNWVAYNGAILRFHLRNAGSSVLVHRQQVRRATDSQVEQLQPLLDALLLTSPVVAALPGPKIAKLQSGSKAWPHEVSLAVSVSGVEPEQAAALFHAEAAERYLVGDLLEQYPAVSQLYAELQSVANLPFDGEPREAQGAAAAAWEALLRQRAFVSKIMLSLHHEARRASEELLGQLHHVQEELERYYLRLQEMDRAKLKAGKALDEAGREVGALKFQLGSVQSELRAQLDRAPDLSIVSSRTLFSTLLRRVVKKVLPGWFLRRRADRQSQAKVKRDLEQIRGSQWFDSEWYLSTYQDVTKADADAAEHYYFHGWKEGRKPGPGFDTTYYLTAYPDVRLAGVNPLLHFTRSGAREGRQPVRPPAPLRRP